MMTYTFNADSPFHGILRVFSVTGDLLGEQEEWSLIDEKQLAKMNAHVAVQGNMMPSDDPRWYTHCLMCGLSVAGQETGYLSGQYHYPTCYQQALEIARRGEEQHG
jgi:hypothetical protein